MERKLQSPALVMRILKYAFVVSAFLFIYIAVKIPAQPHAPVSPQIELVIAFAGLTCVAAGYFLPGLIFKAAQSATYRGSAESQLKRWITKGVISLAYFEACILFGLVLHFLGARAWLVELLIGAGLAAELIWSPGTPPDAAQGSISQD